MKVLSGKVRVKAVPKATLTTSKVLTATKLAVLWLLLPPDAVKEEETGLGVRATDGWFPPTLVLVVLEVPTNVTGAEKLAVLSGTSGGMTDTVTVGMTTSC